ncbi:hypothetical protein [Streptosporangium sandarakinum]|uniref:hypothetical protein n=1 Tax=Streptosporangium sandarakinum TaxID=1260955 RepID=UPI00344099D7
MSGSEAGTLVDAVRRQLSHAGYIVEPAKLAVDGGVAVHHDPGRGVVVAWVGAADLSQLRGYRQVHGAVHLALQALLTRAGYTVTSDQRTGEVIVTGCPTPPHPETEGPAAEAATT